MPDLLESIMKAPGPVKEELQPNSFKMSQIGSKITNSGFRLFGFRKSKVFPLEAIASLLAGRVSAIFGPAKKMQVLSASSRFLQENPNLIAGKLVETIQKPSNKSNNAGFSFFLGLVTLVLHSLWTSSEWCRFQTGT